MTGADKGILLLCCPLGKEDETILNYRQFHGLKRRLEATQCSADKELTESDLRQLGLPSGTAAQIIRLLERETQLDAYIQEGWRRDIFPLTRLDSAYPRVLEHRLKNLAPPILFCKGDPDIFKMPCISVVGSRQIREDNRRFAYRVGELAAKEGYAIVSGGASGADSAAQDACLQNGGKVIVFTPDRLDKFKLSSSVLLCSESGWEIGFSAQRALSRNRLIHAMGSKTVVAQCNFGRGGSWRGAEENLKHHYSPLFVYWDGSRGAIGLLEQGAVEVTVLDSLSELRTGQETFFE